MFLTILQVLQCAFNILYVFEYFSPNSRSCSVCFSFSTFFSFLAIILFLQYVFFNFSCFLVLLAIFYFLQCVFPIFHDIQVSKHIPCPTLCISHFPRFWVFLNIFHFLTVYFTFSMIFSFPAIFQVLECAFLIFKNFQCFSPNSMSYSVCVSFSMFFFFLVFLP